MILKKMPVRRDHESLISGSSQILSNFSQISLKFERNLRELLKIHGNWSPGDIGPIRNHNSTSNNALALSEQLFRGLCAKNVYFGRDKVKFERISENLREFTEFERNRGPRRSRNSATENFQSGDVQLARVQRAPRNSQNSPS